MADLTVIERQLAQSFEVVEHALIGVQLKAVRSGCPPAPGVEDSYRAVLRVYHQALCLVKDWQPATWAALRADLQALSASPMTGESAAQVARSAAAYQVLCMLEGVASC